VTAGDPEEVAAEVRKLLRAFQGWEPQGGLAVCEAQGYPVWAQAMVQRARPGQTPKIAR
jgi:hypothetical protein